MTNRFLYQDEYGAEKKGRPLRDGSSLLKIKSPALPALTLPPSRWMTMLDVRSHRPRLRTIAENGVAGGRIGYVE